MTVKKDESVPAPATKSEAIQKLTDEAEAKGFYGKAVDETPRENYTVKGVVAGKPTPENDK